MAIFALLVAAYGICFGLMNDKAKWLTDPLKRIPLRRDQETGSTFFMRRSPPVWVCLQCLLLRHGHHHPVV
jgi:hypothetical protein